ncbi:hypothetical protein [Salicibibacter cibarius]|uniref:hypothetical protein n=1 Tax=Salicibibacter cibarius TaxID=2743000 RepID=UPI001B7D80CE|nr:hypothetical protein [Salicibibacter cibarius]
MEGKMKGKIWKFGNNINTDEMMPNIAFLESLEGQKKLVFESIRPGWSSQVQEGDIIIGGENFGTGSSRPGAKLLRELGVVAIIADSLNGLFLRNCVNFGVVGLSCQGISSSFEEGEIAEVHPYDGEILNVSKRKVHQAEILPEKLVNLALKGGIEPLLESEGYLKKTTNEK